MFRTGAVRKLGSVDAGDSHLDFHALEQQRGITIYAKQAAIECCGVELTLLDTPGHVDFSSEAERTLQVLDYAVLVIDASDGVRGHTETLWRLLQQRGIPTFVFANKMDSCERSPHEVMAELVSRFSSACVDFTDFNADVQPNGAIATSVPVELAERCAATDEAAIEEFLDTSTISIGALQRLVAQRSIVPVFFGSALKQQGLDEFIRALCPLVREKDYPTEFGARVFKVSHDRSGTRLTWLKVTGGTLEARQYVSMMAETGSVTEKVNQIRRYAGEKHEVVPTCVAGQICAVTGLSQTQAGMTLGVLSDDGCELCVGGLRCTDQELPTPALVPTHVCGVIPRGSDIHAVQSAFDVLTDEDPTLGARWNERLQELQVQIMGAIQLEVLQATLRERFGLDVDFGPSNVLYRETIEQPVTGIGHFEPLRHYAEVHLLIEPMPAGSGVVFGTRCRVDDLDLNWQRLILTNAMEREHLGVLTGSPITDVRITLVGGRAHNKHTEGGDFRQATYRAVRQGLMQATSVLLEPWHSFVLRVPSDQVGRAFSDLQRMGARYDAPLTAGGFAIIEGVVPAKEINDYAMQVSAYTHGSGSLSVQFCGYERCHDERETIERIAYDAESDVSNTPDSVFCSHGAGHVVKWNDVSAMAHVKPDPASFTPWREATPEFFGKA